MSRRRVLILSYYFAPTPSAGAVRMGGLAKYLPDEDWEVTVVTPHRDDRPENPSIVETADADLAVTIKRRLGMDTGAALKDLVAGETAAPASGLRLRARLIDFAKGLIAVPDTNRGWISIAARAAVQAHREHPFDLVLTTSPPPSVHVAGARISKRSALPWVADLRDLWSDDRYSTAPRWRRALDRRIEQRTFAAASALVTVSPPLADELRELHPNAEVHTVFNGFDPDRVNPGTPLSDVFAITHTGTYHQGRRDPSILFEAAGNLIRRGLIPPERFRIRLFVKHEPWLMVLAERHGVAPLVDLVPWAAPEKMIEAQRRSQILLLLHWGGPREAGIVTAKVFDYLAARRPILVLGGNEGALRTLIEETAGGLQLGTVEAIEEQLTAWWREFERTGSVAWHGDPEIVGRYSHRRMAREFAEIFETVLSRPRRRI